MFKTLKDFDTAVRAILMKIRDEEDYEILRQDYSDENFEDALEYCVQHNLITGLHVQRTASGKLLADVIGKVKITREGLKFIDTFNN